MEIKKHITDLSGNKVTTPDGTAFRVDKIKMGRNWITAKKEECDIDNYDHCIVVRKIGDTGMYDMNLYKKGWGYIVAECNLKTV